MKKLNILFLLIGLSVFGFFIYTLGSSAFVLIKENINFFYFSCFLLTILIYYIPYTMRFKTILESYGGKYNLFRLMKHSICAFAVSYLTPASRIGGEPVRIYLLNKECGVDYKRGTTAVILDKFVEILGSSLFGIIGLILLITLFEIPNYFKIIFGMLVFLSLTILFLFYKRSIERKPTLSFLFRILKLRKIKKIKKYEEPVKEIEQDIGEFFKYKKKVFFKSLFFYLICGIFFMIELKFLLLSIGLNYSISQLILMVNVWGVTNFIPTPASLGFLEAGQSGLSYLFDGSGSYGMAISLILRVGYLMMVSLGFLFILDFGWKEFFRKKHKNK